MLYRLFLYKTAAATADAPAIDIVNCAITSDSEIDWNEDSADDFMHNFDAEKIKKKLENATISENGTPLCRTVVKHSPQNKIEYIFSNSC